MTALQLSGGQKQMIGTAKNATLPACLIRRAAERSNPMSGPELDEMSRGQRQKSDTTRTQLAFVEGVFLALLKLLEQYAPTWYTEEHHNQAVAALRVLQESRPLTKEAARSKKAG